MRMQGGIRIDNIIGIEIRGGGIIEIDNKSGYHKVHCGFHRITNELLHALVVDYSFHQLQINDIRYSIHDIILRRKAIRRIIHNAEVMHKVIDREFNCPLLSRGKSYAWNKEVYDFTLNKFILK